MQGLKASGEQYWGGGSAQAWAGDERPRVTDLEPVLEETRGGRTLGTPSSPLRSVGRGQRAGAGRGHGGGNNTTGEGGQEPGAMRFWREGPPLASQVCSLNLFPGTCHPEGGKLHRWAGLAFDNPK